MLCMIEASRKNVDVLTMVEIVRPSLVSHGQITCVYGRLQAPAFLRNTEGFLCDTATPLL